MANFWKDTDWNNVAEKGISIGTGLLNIANTGIQAAQIQEDPEFDQRLANMRGAGTYGYTDYGQILGEMNNFQSLPRQDADDIRGMNTGQKIASLGSGALSGASAGMAFGPWGALVGGVLGAAGAGFGIHSGNQKARAMAEINNYRAEEAERNAQLNYGAAIEGIANKNAIQGAVHSVRRGGPIRKQMNIHEYASKVLGQRSSFYRPERKFVDGGLSVRIKVK